MNKSVNSVRFNGYKSFRDDTISEISMAPYVSVFVGKNNCGKSTCFDVLESVFEPEYFKKNNTSFSRVSISFALDEENIECGFSKTSFGGVPGGGSNYQYGVKFVGEKIYADLSVKYSSYGEGTYLCLELSEFRNDIVIDNAKRKWAEVIRGVNDYDRNYEFRRIDADRDIVPEKESAHDKLEYDGVGATNIIRRFINHSQYDEKLVEDLLLNELNSIMAPDSVFSNIRVQEIEGRF